MSQEFFAHSVEGKPKSEWQGLELFERFLRFKLLKRVERFLRFERLKNAGLWHDLGKYLR